MRKQTYKTQIGLILTVTLIGLLLPLYLTEAGSLRTKGAKTKGLSPRAIPLPQTPPRPPRTQTLSGAGLSFEHIIIDASGPGGAHCKAVGDIDGDGFVDVIVGGGGLVWYAYPLWEKTLIDSGGFTTDMQVADIDNDGDLDIIIPRGAGGANREIRWYENPRPTGDPRTSAWTPHIIGVAETGHDVEVADFNGDGRIDVVTRKGRERTYLWLQNSPDSWTQITVSTRSGQGTALGDIDGDGDPDIAHNGFWVETPSDLLTGDWIEHTIDTGWPGDVGVHIVDLDGNGRNDVLLAPAESSGRLSWYETTNPHTGPWTEHIIDSTVSYFHTFKTADMDNDGDLDVVTAEMHQSSDPDEISVYLNQDGAGLSWEQLIVDTTGSHNLRVADIGSDGDIDIFGVNWTTGAPNGAPIEMWENKLADVSLDDWQRYLIDGAATPTQAVFIYGADVDGDSQKDIITGSWWYQNPGTPSGVWNRNTIGEPFNVAIVYDFDGDGDVDILGTAGSNQFVWARNEGGTFTIIDNVQDAPSGADFLQGIAIDHFGSGGSGPLEIALSWHRGGQGVQMLTVPPSPSTQVWTWRELSPTSQDEALSAGDIDGDGDRDLFLGTKWLRNEGTSWTVFDANPGAGGSPDRNRLADIDGDGDLDAVVGFEGSGNSLIWLEAPAVPTQIWNIHIIATGIGGGYSLDVADLDYDGDVDVVLGEHNGARRVLIYENEQGGTSWIEHLVDDGTVGGIDHHDGTRVVDIDNDGLLDIISIGWYNDKVWLFENKATLPKTLGPVASFSYNFLTPLEVEFDGSASYDPSGRLITDYAWDFGDGTSISGTEAIVTHTYGAVGMYSVTLTVTNEAGQTGSIIHDIYAGPPLLLVNPLSLDFTTGQTQLPFTVTNIGSGSLSYQITTSGQTWLRVSPTSGSSAGEIDTITVTVDRTDLEPGNYTATITVDAQAAGRETVSVTMAVTEDLILHLMLDEGTGTIAYDTSGNANHATLYGPTWSEGYIGGALEFDGIDDYALISDADSLDLDYLTIAGWLYLNAYHDDQRILTKEYGTSQPYSIYTLLVSGANDRKLELRLGIAGQRHRLPSYSDLPLGEWVHIAATYDGSHAVLYINGVADRSYSLSGVIQDNNQPIYIGASQFYSPRFLDGKLDELRLYNRALTPGEIQQLMQGPTLDGDFDEDGDVDMDDYAMFEEAYTGAGRPVAPGYEYADLDGDGDVDLDDFAIFAANYTG